MELGSITVYPLKSARGVSLETADLDDFGLEGDRRWMVVDGQGVFVSQRESPAMALVQVRMEGTGLVLEAPGRRPVTVARPGSSATPVEVIIWQDRCAALTAGDEAAAWFTGHLGFPARLVYMPSDTWRRANPAYVAENRRVSFADAYPVLVVGDGSLAELNRRMAAPLPMNRFRPNLVVTGSEPFAEDEWPALQVGEITFDLVKPCDRCVTTTVDQATAEKGKEPLRTLATFRKRGGQVYFGMNAVHRAGGRLRVGDPVHPLGR